MSEHNNLLADLQTSEQTHFNRFERDLSNKVFGFAIVTYRCERLS